MNKLKIIATLVIIIITGTTSSIILYNNSRPPSEKVERLMLKIEDDKRSLKDKDADAKNLYMYVNQTQIPHRRLAAVADRIIIEKIKTGDVYKDSEFGFILTVLGLIKKSKGVSDNIEFIKRVAEYTPNDKILTGYNILKAEAAVLLMEEQSMRLQKALDESRKMINSIGQKPD